MAINYTPVGWDTNKYLNPTNMKHMDEDGIKAACDGVDAIGTNYIKASDSGAQVVTNTSTDSILPLVVQGDSADNSIIQFRGKNGATFGSIGSQANKPIFRNTSGVNKEIALVDSLATVSNITTKNDTYIDSISLSYIKVGKLVIVTGSFKPKAVNTPAATSLFSGLPTAASNGFATAVGASASGYKLSILAGNNYIMKDEVLASPSNQWMNFTLIYMATN